MSPRRKRACSSALEQGLIIQDRVFARVFTVLHTLLTLVFRPFRIRAALRGLAQFCSQKSQTVENAVNAHCFRPARTTCFDTVCCGVDSRAQDGARIVGARLPVRTSAMRGSP